MCHTCDMVNESDAPVNDLLEVIGFAIKIGGDPEHFKPILDKLLNEEVEERDTDVESAWEDSYRETD